MHNSIRFSFVLIAIMTFTGCKKPTSQPLAQEDQTAVLDGAPAGNAQVDPQSDGKSVVTVFEGKIGDLLKLQATAMEKRQLAKIDALRAAHEKELSTEQKRHAQEVNRLKSQIKQLEARPANASAQSDKRTPEECRRLDANLKSTTDKLATLEKGVKLSERLAEEVHKDAVGIELQMQLDALMAAEKNKD